MRRQQVRSDKAHRAMGPVPASAMALSLLALGVAAGAAVLWPGSLRQYSSLAWLLALVPCMLLAYHKGWRGAAAATALTMATIALTQALLVLWLNSTVDWRLLGVVVLTFVSVSIVVGILSQLHLRDRERDAGAAYADVDTGLPNERILDLFLVRYFATARRGQDLAAVAFRIDGIEAFRAKRGEKGATRAVSAFARILDSNTRVMDVCSRYADNLFVCLLPRTNAQGAFSYALRVRKAVETSGLLKGTGLTVSGGVAAYMPEMHHRSDLIAAAREALEAAIGEGGNRVMVCVTGTEVLADPALEDSAGRSATEEAELVPTGPAGSAAPSTKAAGKRSAPTRTSLVALSRRRRR